MASPDVLKQMVLIIIIIVLIKIIIAITFYGLFSLPSTVLSTAYEVSNAFQKSPTKLYYFYSHDTDFKMEAWSPGRCVSAVIVLAQKQKRQRFNSHLRVGI